MKWEDYKNLTDEQKEEYQFKFGINKFTILKPSSLTMTASVFILSITNLIFLTYLSAVSPALQQFRDKAIFILQETVTIIHIGIAFLMIEAIMILWIIIGRLWSEYKWKKENGIKTPWYKL